MLSWNLRASGALGFSGSEHNSGAVKGWTQGELRAFKNPLKKPKTRDPKTLQKIQRRAAAGNFKFGPGGSGLRARGLVVNIGHRVLFSTRGPQRQRAAAGQPARGDRPQAARTGLSWGARKFDFRVIGFMWRVGCSVVHIVLGLRVEA